MSDVDLAVERWLFLHATESSYDCVELILQLSEEKQSDKGNQVLFRRRWKSKETVVTFVAIKLELGIFWGGGIHIAGRHVPYPLRNHN